VADLQELERPIDEAISRSLVELIPDTWDSIQLEITRDDANEDTFAHVITGPQGHRELIMPSDTIFEHTFKLADLFSSFGKLWKKVVYTVERKADGNWKYSADFIY
jgi:hypothetical protein